MISPPTSFVTHTKSATGTYHLPNDKNLYGTLQNVNYHRSLDTRIANNALSADVRCKEVCVYCFEVFTLASQYIAHADTHRDADMTKNSYTRQICDRLRQNVAESLDNCQLKGVKRTRELAGTPAARRSRRSWMLATRLQTHRHRIFPVSLVSTLSHLMKLLYSQYQRRRCTPIP